MRWLSNTDGKPDFVMTLSLVGFVFVVLKLLIAGSSMSFGDTSFAFGEIGAAEIGAVLTPTLGAYCARRYTDKKYPCRVRKAK